MTELLFRDDAYLKACAAQVVAVDERGIRLDRTVFYPTGGGQPGDTGSLRLTSSVRRCPTRRRPRSTGRKVPARLWRCS